MKSPNDIFVECNKRKRITENQVREYLGLLKALPIRLEHRTLWNNVDLESLARHGFHEQLLVSTKLCKNFSSEIGVFFDRTFRSAKLPNRHGQLDA